LLARIAQAVVAESNRHDSYVVQAPLGSTHTELFQRPEIDRLSDASMLGRLVEIMQVVDCVQPSEHEFSAPPAQPGYLSEVFPRVLANARFESAPLSAADQQRLQAARTLLFGEVSDLAFVKTPDYAEFCLQRAQLEQTELRQLELDLQLQKPLPTEQRASIQIELDSVRALNQQRKALFDALDKLHEFSAAERVVSQLEREVDVVPPSVRQAIDGLPLMVVKDPNPPSDQHVVCSFLPAQLAEEGWIPVRLSREDILAHGSAGSADGVDEDWIESIELEVQTLSCDRSWFWAGLFSHRKWTWQQPGAPVQGPNGTSAIPAYVQGLVFCRNLTVRQRAGLPAEAQGQTSLQTKLGASGVLTALVRHSVSTQGLQVLSTAGLKQARARSLPAAAKPTSLGMSVTVSPRVINTSKATQLEIVGSTKLIDRGALNRFITAIPRAAASGRVLSTTGAPIRDATVELQGGSSRVGSTDEQGRFTFSGLVAGKYLLRFSRAGFQASSLSIVVPSDTVIEARLTPSATCPLRVQLVQRSLEGERPFLGHAMLAITGSESRLESFAGQDTRELLLAPGKYSIVLTSPEAERVDPSERTIVLRADAPAEPLKLTVYVAPVLQNPQLQLLGCICKRVAAFPDH
jgi:hypothetical protein